MNQCRGKVYCSEVAFATRTAWESSVNLKYWLSEGSVRYYLSGETSEKLEQSFQFKLFCFYMAGQHTTKCTCVCFTVLVIEIVRSITDILESNTSEKWNTIKQNTAYNFEASNEASSAFVVIFKWLLVRHSGTSKKKHCCLFLIMSFFQLSKSTSESSCFLYMGQWRITYWTTSGNICTCQTWQKTINQ